MYWNGRLRSVIVSALQPVNKKREEPGLKYNKNVLADGKKIGPVDRK